MIQIDSIWELFYDYFNSLSNFEYCYNTSGLEFSWLRHVIRKQRWRNFTFKFRGLTNLYTNNKIPNKNNIESVNYKLFKAVPDQVGISKVRYAVNEPKQTTVQQDQKSWILCHLQNGWRIRLYYLRDRPNRMYP